MGYLVEVVGVDEAAVLRAEEAEALGLTVALGVVRLDGDGLAAESLELVSLAHLGLAHLQHTLDGLPGPRGDVLRHLDDGFLAEKRLVGVLQGDPLHRGALGVL